MYRIFCLNVKYLKVKRDEFLVMNISQCICMICTFCKLVAFVMLFRKVTKVVCRRLFGKKIQNFQYLCQRKYNHFITPTFKKCAIHHTKNVFHFTITIMDINLSRGGKSICPIEKMDDYIKTDHGSIS